MTNPRSGACLCGAVSFTVTGPVRSVIACHCRQCRKQSGHYFAATAAPDAAIAISGEDNVTWYRASETAQRGFCASCGSILFWKRNGSEQLSISAGSFDEPTGLRLERHIYCADKGDYYEIGDGLPQDQER